MGTLNLTAVTPDTPYIKKIKAALEKGTGDKIPIVEVGLLVDRNWFYTSVQVQMSSNLN